MQIHLLGMFANVFDSYFSTSLLGRAREEGVINFFYHDLRQYSGEGRVDDRCYGGGRGMVFLPEVVAAAIRDIKSHHKIDRVILMSPRGHLLKADKARKLSTVGNILIVCGRYEGVDQRVIDLLIDEEISIGDYVLSGGELAACVLVDALCRFIPGIIGQESSVTQDSFEDGLLEHSHFTRPEVFEGMAVPPVLLSGDHGKISQWRRDDSLLVTWQRRPDLLKKAKLVPEELEKIKQLIHKTKS